MKLECTEVCPSCGEPALLNEYRVQNKVAYKLQCLPCLSAVGFICLDNETQADALAGMLELWNKED
jgi:hypothetical protein